MSFKLMERPRRGLSRAWVHRGCFHSPSARALQDARVVQEVFPPATRYLELDGLEGWLFQVRSEFDDAFTFLGYHDGHAYQVALVLPEVAGRYRVSLGRVFPDGTLASGPTGRDGQVSLEQAFQRARRWATAFSALVRSGRPGVSPGNAPAALRQHALEPPAHRRVPRPHAEVHRWSGGA